MVVVGSGVAGPVGGASRLQAAGRRVVLVTKTVLDAGSTRWAQGGVAAALGPDDDPEQHLADTLVAGVGICDEAAVQRAGPRGTAPGPRARRPRRGLRPPGRRRLRPDPRGRPPPRPGRPRRRGRDRAARCSGRCSPPSAARARRSRSSSTPWCSTCCGPRPPARRRRTAGRRASPCTSSARAAGTASAPCRARAVVLATGGLGPGLRQHHQPGRLDRRRGRPRAAGRRGRGRPRVRPVPPDRAVARRRLARPAAAGQRGRPR